MAAVLGGVALSGGGGTILGALVGAAILVAITNAVLLFGLPIQFQLKTKPGASRPISPSCRSCSPGQEYWSRSREIGQGALIVDNCKLGMFPCRQRADLSMPPIFVTVVGAPDEISALALNLSISALGNVRTESLRAFSAAEMMTIVNKML